MMTPAKHRKLCYCAIAFWSVLGALAGLCVVGWSGLVWVIPGFLLGAVLHKAIMEHLPIRCPQCGNKAQVYHLNIPGLGGSNVPLPGNCETGGYSRSYYGCKHCKFEEDTRF